jgi:uncharacterized protein YndB with AHSA1/START domain
VTERSAEHATFTIDHTYDAAPTRVFAAWADQTVKSRWFGAPDDWETTEYALDFRVGGRETNRAGAAGGPVYTYEARYADIVPNERIAYTYTMDCDDARISVSVVTVEFKHAGEGTLLTLTEQGVFLDGLDKPADREHGTRELLKSLDEALRDSALPR